MFSTNNGKLVLGVYDQKLCNDHLSHMDAFGKGNYNVYRHLFLGCNFVPCCHNNISHLFVYLLRPSLQLNPSLHSLSSFSLTLILLQLCSHNNIIFTISIYNVIINSSHMHTWSTQLYILTSTCMRHYMTLS